MSEKLMILVNYILKTKFLLPALKPTYFKYINNYNLSTHFIYKNNNTYSPMIGICTKFIQISRFNINYSFLEYV